MTASHGGSLREFPRRNSRLVPDRDSPVSQIVRMVVRDTGNLARPDHRLIGGRLRRAREHASFRCSVLERTGGVECLHKPFGQVDPASVGGVSDERARALSVVRQERPPRPPSRDAAYKPFLTLMRKTAIFTVHGIRSASALPGSAARSLAESGPCGEPCEVTNACSQKRSRAPSLEVASTLQ